MRLSSYIQRTRALGDLPVSNLDLDAIGDLIASGGTFSDVLARRSATLSPLVLLGIWRAARRHAEHQAYLNEVVERRRADGLSPIAAALLKQTVARHEVAVLERAEALAPPGRAAEHRRRDAIKSAMTLWAACLVILRKQARLHIELDTSDAGLVDSFGDYAGNFSLTEVPAHRWLAIRRGERLGALRLRFDLPMEAMLSQIEARAVDLSPVAAGRDADVLLEALVLTDLEEWSLSLKDEEAELLAIRNACNAYLGLLTTPRADVPIVAAVSVPARGPLGVAIVLRDGRMVDSAAVDVGDNPVAAVERKIGGHPVEAMVLPVESSRADLLKQLVDGFAGLTELRTGAKAMRPAVEALTEQGPPAVLEALVLARRVVNPLNTWLAVDPVRLGLAEYQQELDEDALRAALTDMQALAKAGVGVDDLNRTKSAPTSARPAPRPPSRPLNPMIKSVDDLRPGMEVDAVVTNITQFGAFLNIGLNHEGLVHVSELADHFVNDPNEVVTVGQQVRARVLGVDRGRRRISLSLRAERAPRLGPPTDATERPGADRIDRGRVPLDDVPGRGRSGPRPGGFGGPPRTGGNVSRAQALADLEALFKK